MNSSSSSKKQGPVTCSKNVSDNGNAILCDFCQTWVYIKCNYLNYIDYKYLHDCSKPWYFLSCTTTMLLPFGNLSNQKFLGFITGFPKWG